jgi:acetoin utilization deacetylase AcuC-like enzyme
MIEQGKVTLLGDSIYLCEKIEDGMAYLKKVGDEKRGRYRKMGVELVPYLDEKNELVTPKPRKISRKKMQRFHYMKWIKEAIDEEMSVSHDLSYFVSEWLENLMMDFALLAQHNAEIRGDDTITAAHWYWWDLPPEQGEGFFEENRQTAKSYKEYLENGRNHIV